MIEKKWADVHTPAVAAFIRKFHDYEFNADMWPEIIEAYRALSVGDMLELNFFMSAAALSGLGQQPKN